MTTSLASATCGDAPATNENMAKYKTHLGVKRSTEAEEFMRKLARFYVALERVVRSDDR